MADMSEGAALVRRAFDAARASGKEDWHQMTIPVLKNRILSITGNHFREADYGASSFRDFLKRLPGDFITLDDSRPPGFVTLNSDDVSHSAAPVASYPRVRSDLWRAALDYSSGRRYVWDPAVQQARPATQTENGPFLPTAAADDLRAWRAAFSQSHSDGLSGENATRLGRWASESLPTAFLPARLRPLWNTELKRRVEERLQQWFRDRHFDLPTDLVSIRPSKPTARSSVEQLRRFVFNCVESMTEEELLDLKIPARAAMRVKAPDER